jgi:hypothetical protein
LFFGTAKKWFPEVEPLCGLALYSSVSETEMMLVERGLQVKNVEVVGDAYAIASNYLRKSGVITGTISPNERLLELIVEMFHRGEANRIKLANRAIAKFEAAQIA